MGLISFFLSLSLSEFPAYILCTVGFRPSPTVLQVGVTLKQYI